MKKFLPCAIIICFKKLYILFLTVFFSLSNLSAREFETDRGTLMVNCAANYSGSQGKLYKYMGSDRASSMILIPSVDYLIMQNLFIGSAFAYSRFKNDSREDNILGAGPEIGYISGKPENRILPVFSTGYLFTRLTRNFPDLYGGYSDLYGFGTGYGGYGGYDPYDNSLNRRKVSGRELFISIGIIVPVKSRIGLSISCLYRHHRYEPTLATKVSGNVIALKIGVNGLLL